VDTNCTLTINVMGILSWVKAHLGAHINPLASSRCHMMTMILVNYQHWPRSCFVAWLHQAITCSNVDSRKLAFISIQFHWKIVKNTDQNWYSDKTILQYFWTSLRSQWVNTHTGLHTNMKTWSQSKYKGCLYRYGNSHYKVGMVKRLS